MGAQHFAKPLFPAEMEEARQTLCAIVQYRTKRQYGPWTTMAAFDSLDVAERYADGCATEGSPWEYRWGKLNLGGEA